MGEHDNAISREVPTEAVRESRDGAGVSPDAPSLPEVHAGNDPGDGSDGSGDGRRLPEGEEAATATGDGGRESGVGPASEEPDPSRHPLALTPEEIDDALRAFDLNVKTRAKEFRDLKRPDALARQLKYSHFLVRCAQTAEEPVDKIQHVINCMVDVIGAALAKSPYIGLGIEGLGHLRVVRHERVTGSNTYARQIYFRADPEFIDAINNPKPIIRGPIIVANRGALSLKHRLMPPRAARPEDRAILKRWVDDRMTAVTPDTIYATPGGDLKPLRAWSPRTGENVFKYLLYFSRFCNASLIRLGLDGQPESGPMDLRLLRAEVVNFAALYNDYMQKRVAALYPKLVDVPDIAWRSLRWRIVVSYGHKFYQWLEREGYRPPNTNPFDHIRRHNVILFKGRRIMDFDVYARLLRYPLMTHRDRAAIMLMANGLRRVEVCRVRIADLNLVAGTLEVRGKGNKWRTVVLYQRTVTALSAWLKARRRYASPLIFPGRKGRQMVADSMNRIFKKVARRAFYTEPEKYLALNVHGLRHFYTSEARVKFGIPIDIVMANLGHSKMAMTLHYTSVDLAHAAMEIRAKEQPL